MWFRLCLAVFEAAHSTSDRVFDQVYDWVTKIAARMVLGESGRRMNKATAPPAIVSVGYRQMPVCSGGGGIDREWESFRPSGQCRVMSPAAVLTSPAVLCWSAGCGVCLDNVFIWGQHCRH